MPAAKCSSTESARFLTCCRYLLPTGKRRREFHQYNLGDKNPCTRRFLHNSHGLIISVRPSSDITRPHAGKAQACRQESSISQQPCRAADGPAPANRNAVCLQNARPSIGMTYVLLLSSALHCFLSQSFCSLLAARFSRYMPAYLLVVRYCSESSRHHYRKMKWKIVHY